MSRPIRFSPHTPLEAKLTRNSLVVNRILSDKRARSWIESEKSKQTSDHVNCNLFAVTRYFYVSRAKVRNHLAHIRAQALTHSDTIIGTSTRLRYSDFVSTASTLNISPQMWKTWDSERQCAHCLHQTVNNCATERTLRISLLWRSFSVWFRRFADFFSLLFCYSSSSK